MKIAPTNVCLIVDGHPIPVLWKLRVPGSLCDNLIWAKREVQGYLKPDALQQNATMARGTIRPEDVLQGVIEVREGVEVLSPNAYDAPRFVKETLIVRNFNGTWSPAVVWVGEKLTYIGQEDAQEAK